MPYLQRTTTPKLPEPTGKRDQIRMNDRLEMKENPTRTGAISQRGV